MRSSGSVEADPGPVGQVGDPFRSQHRREGAEHACQAPARHDCHPADHHLAPGTWRHGPPQPAPPPPRRGQSGLGRPGRPRTTLRVVRRRGVAAVPAARTGRAGGGPDTAWSRPRTPHQARSPDDRCWPGYAGWPDLSGWPTRAAPADPRRAVRRSSAAPRRQATASGPEPQPPASRHGRQHTEDQAQARREQAGQHSPTSTDPEDEGDPPGQAPGPGGPLGRPQPPPTSQDARHLSAVTSPACRDGS